MNTKEKVILAVVATVAIVLGLFALGGSNMSVGGPTGTASSATLSSALAGPQSSVTALAQNSSRQGAILSMPIGATSSVHVCLSATCSATTGITLGTPTSTNPSFLVLPIDPMYTGIITVYASASGTRVMTTTY